MFTLVGFAVLAALLIVYLNQTEAKVFAQMVRITVVTLFMIFIVGQLTGVLEILQELAAKMNMQEAYLGIVLKVIGIAYLAEFGYQLCKDAGEEAIGSKVQLAGKVMIFVMASPVILALVQLITDLL